MRDKLSTAILSSSAVRPAHHEAKEPWSGMSEPCCTTIRLQQIGLIRPSDNVESGFFWMDMDLLGVLFFGYNRLDPVPEGVFYPSSTNSRFVGTFSPTLPVHMVGRSITRSNLALAAAANARSAYASAQGSMSCAILREVGLNNSYNPVHVYGPDSSEDTGNYPSPGISICSRVASPHSYPETPFQIPSLVHKILYLQHYLPSSWLRPFLYALASRRCLFHLKFCTLFT